MQTNGVNNSPAFGMKLQFDPRLSAEAKAVAEQVGTSLKGELSDSFTAVFAPRTEAKFNGGEKIVDGMAVTVMEKIKSFLFFNKTKPAGAAVAKEVTAEAVSTAAQKAIVDATTPLTGSSKL